jgi:hypothetical protein
MEIKDEDFDARLREKLNSLNRSYPSALPDAKDLWEDIDHRLSAKQKKRRFTNILSLAATVCLLLAACIGWLIGKKSDPSTLVYRIETIEIVSEPVFSDTDNTEKQAIKFIEAQCKAYQVACRSTEFLELKAELEQVEIEKQKVNRQRQLYGPSPALIKAEIRLENYKMYLIRELIETLKS